MTTLHFLILAGIAWRVVKWKHSPRRNTARRGDRTPWVVAALSDAVLFGGLAYREHRRKVRAGKPTATRDRRKSTWTTSTPLGADPPSNLRRGQPGDEVPF